MRQYNELVEHIIGNGIRKPTRAKLASTGQTIDAITVFGYQTRFDLSIGFPLLTTKKLPFKAIAHELIWFIRGNSNIKYLTDNKVTIWDEWADANGDLGPVYPHQWRHFGQTDTQNGVDQLQNIVNDINAVIKNPEASVGRRLIMMSWNPIDVPHMALPPCHCFCQFMVTEGKLSCLLYMRSADTFLGVPFNIASYALLTSIIAQITNLKPGEFIITFGDVHIYMNHIEQIREQITRPEYDLPILKLSPEIVDLETVTIDRMEIVNYKHHPPLKGEVAI